MRRSLAMTFLKTQSLEGGASDSPLKGAALVVVVRRAYSEVFPDFLKRRKNLKTIVMRISKH